MNTSRLAQSLGMSFGTSRLLWILAAGILMSSLPGRLQAAEEQEMWYGVLDAGARHFRFVVTLTKQDEDWSGVLKSLDEGGADFRLDGVVRTKEKLEFQIKVSSALYSANIDEATHV